VPNVCAKFFINTLVERKFVLLPTADCCTGHHQSAAPKDVKGTRRVVPESVSAEVTGTEYDQIMAEAKVLRKVALYQNSPNARWGACLQPFAL
jgi:hypothetical protein